MSDRTPSEPAKVRVATATCPNCGGPTHARYRPFCSRRCADVDLNRWFGETYRVPTEEPPSPEGLSGIDDD